MTDLALTLAKIPTQSFAMLFVSYMFPENKRGKFSLLIENIIIIHPYLESTACMITVCAMKYLIHMCQMLNTLALRLQTHWTQTHNNGTSHVGVNLWNREY